MAREYQGRSKPEATTENAGQLKKEVNALRKRVSELEKLEDEQRLAQEKLWQSEENIKKYIESVPDGICILDLEGTFIYGNSKAERILGYKSEELIGKKCTSLKLLPEKYLQKALEKLESIIRGEPTVPDEFEIIRKDGEHIWVEVNTVTMKQDDRAAIVGFIRDITERKRTDEELKASEAKYKSLVNNVSLGVFRSTPGKHGRFIEVNSAMEAITGYSREELLKIGVSRLYDNPDEREQFIKKAAAVKRKITHEITFRKKDGEKIIVADTKTTVRDKSGKVIYFDGILEDITERKSIEQELKGSRERLQILMEESPVMICNVDIDGVFTYVNTRFEEDTGYSKKRIIGKNGFELGIFKDETVALIRQRMVERIKGSQPVPLEVRFRRKDGNWIWISIIAETIRDKNENTGFQIIAQDITQRKQMEQKLKESEERYRALYEGTYDIVQSVNHEGRFVYVNPSWIRTLGYNREELPGITLYDIIHPRSFDYCKTMFKKVIAGESVHNLEATFITKEGRSIQVEGSAVPYIVSGKVVATQGFFHDVTERKKMEEHLLVTDRLASIGELASGIAHELNNPLTGVIGFSELMLEKDVSNEIKEDIAIIHHEAVRAAEVVKNLLTFARRHEPSRQPVNINSTIASVLGLRAYEQKVNNIKVITRFDSDLPMIEADGFQLQQVFLNIILNAEYAMQEANKGGILTITTERLKDTVRISFADNGTGISEKNMKHIFDPFFTTKDVGSGTGLGLSICHGIVAEHEGKLYAQNGPDGGAAFIVELPVKAKDNKDKGSK